VEALNDMLRLRAKVLGNKPFLIAGSKVCSYAELDQSAARLAHVLQSYGVRKGDPVGIYLPSCIEFAVSYFAAQKLGAIATSISSLYKFREVRGIVERTDMKVVLTDSTTRALAEQVKAELPCLANILSFGIAGEGACEMQMANHPPHFDDVFCQIDDIASLFFTSGTTSAPKGTMQSHKALFATLRDMSVYTAAPLGREVFLCVLPLFNNFGATCIMDSALFSGGTVVLQPRWDTEQVLQGIAEHRATIMIGTPTMFIYMLRAYDPQRHDLSSLRIGVTGGAPVAPQVIEEFENKTKVPLVQIYGATESGGYVTGEPYQGIRKRGSAGVPFGGTRISIVGPEGEELPAGKIGEVRIAGDVVVPGYWRDPEANRQSFTSAGWLSGDLGYLDEDGYLFIVDRKKDVIISGGYNIFPLEVEDLLYQHPSIAVCAVVGVQDEVKGEIPVACVILKEGVNATDTELIAYCREHIAVYKAPRKIVFMQAFPLGPSGKILKRELRELLKAVAPAPSGQ
jgi:long-chain acyl-CoA synthetase